MRASQLRLSRFARVSPLVMALALLIPALSAARSRKSVIRDTMPAVAMILAVDVENGQLVPKSSGSGTIIDSNGSIITNHHVLYDAQNKKMRDLFIVGLFRAADREPELICAGEPKDGQLKPDLDLALIRCDRDRDGTPWRPSAWPTIPIRQIDKDDVVPGEQVWVLGYPGVGGNTISVTAGLVSGWTGEHGGAGSRAFMKTDASITHGNSGGTAIDEDGNFIGVPTAFRLTTTRQGDAVVAAGRVGLIRPLDHALDLIEQARRGGPGAPPKSKTKASPEALRIVGRIVDSKSGKGIEGATLIVFKPGIAAQDLDATRLDEQALVWTRSDAAGRFVIAGTLERGTSYTVAISATGYLSLRQSQGLQIPGDAAAVLEPWDEIALQPQ